MSTIEATPAVDTAATLLHQIEAHIASYGSIPDDDEDCLAVACGQEIALKTKLAAVPGALQAKARALNLDQMDLGDEALLRSIIDTLRADAVDTAAAMLAEILAIQTSYAGPIDGDDLDAATERECDLKRQLAELTGPGVAVLQLKAAQRGFHIDRNYMDVGDEACIAAAIAGA